MAKTVVMRREGQKLTCVCPWEIEALEELPEGKDLNVKITQARSVRQNNTYWGLLKFVIENGPEFIGKYWPEPQHLSDALQLKTGFVRQSATLDGEIKIWPQSKNFEEMPQDVFNRYFEAAHIELIAICDFDPLPLYLSRKRSAA